MSKTIYRHVLIRSQTKRWRSTIHKYTHINFETYTVNFCILKDRSRLTTNYNTRALRNHIDKFQSQLEKNDNTTSVIFSNLSRNIPFSLRRVCHKRTYLRSPCIFLLLRRETFTLWSTMSLGPYETLLLDRRIGINSREKSSQVNRMSTRYDVGRKVWRKTTFPPSILYLVHSCINPC